jgi:hypothetical protein
VRALLRAAASVAALVTIYYLLPLNHSPAWLAVTILVIGLFLLVGLVTYQVRSIVALPYPGLRAVEALTTSVPLFLRLFAATYVVLATIPPNYFSEPVSRTDVLYFTVTVFATRGPAHVLLTDGTWRTARVTGRRRNRGRWYVCLRWASGRSIWHVHDPRYIYPA